MEKFCKLVLTAFDHHGGQNSPLYSFASCGGVVHDETHREQLIKELAKCIEWYMDHIDLEQINNLVKLRYYIIKAQIGFCLAAGEMYDKRHRASKT